MNKIRGFMGRILLVGAGCLIGLLLAEGLLRVFNPLPVRVAGDEIKLFKNYQREIIIGEGAEHMYCTAC